MKKKNIFLIALILIYSFSYANEDASTDVLETQLENQNTNVEIETSRVKLKRKSCNCDYLTDTPYTERRTTWGGYFGIQYGSYIPVNYVPSYSTGTTFSNLYTVKSGSIEILFGLKLNFFLGSLSAQITSGYFSASTTTQNGPTLTIIPVLAGVRYALDNIFKEPYVVPYVHGGMYTGLYTEAQQGLSVRGNSAFAPYYGVGMLFQLDWLDKDTHESGYEDFGLENTFLFAEGRSFLPATNNLPDLSTPIQIFGGLQTEF